MSPLVSRTGCTKMAAQDSDSEEDFVTFGKPLEQYEEGNKKLGDALV